MDYLGVTKRDLEAEKALRQIYMKRLTEMPEGSIAFKNIRGKIYYYHMMPGSKKQTYIKCQNNTLINNLKEKKFLIEALKILDENIKIQEKVLKSIMNIHM